MQVLVGDRVCPLASGRRPRPRRACVVRPSEPSEPCLTHRLPTARAFAALFACLLLVAASRARATDAGPGECAPPRTLVALLPLADQTDHSWELMSGESPAHLVCRLLADSLERGRGRRVECLSLGTNAGSAAAPRRAVDDDLALRAARHDQAEVVVTGTVSVFSHDDTRESPRLGRWGVGAPDARSRARVSITLRVLDARNGTVIIETTAARDRADRATASATQPAPDAPDPAADPSMEDVLSDVLGDLLSTIGERLDASWQARVVAEGRDEVVLDAGSARGLFAGERLEVWRPGIQLYDEYMLQLGDETRVGAVVISSVDGRGRAHARLAEGDVHTGYLVRPCSGANGPAMSLRH